VLTEAGVKAGDTVAVMDWDSHRYLECMFAIPMIGAVVHTINVRLSPEQILYTMNHAEDRFVLVNSEFVGLYQAIAGQLTTVDKTVLLTDGPDKTADLPAWSASTSNCWPPPARTTTSRFRRELGGHHLLHHRHHRQPQGRVLHPSPTGAAHPGRGDGHRQHRQRAPAGQQRRVHADHADVPRACLGPALCGDHARHEAGLPGRYDPDMLVKLWREEKVTFSHCVPTILQMLLNARPPRGGLRRLEDHHRRQRAQPLAVRGGPGPGHPADGGVWHVGDLPADLRRAPER
jgi:fatty-acyl-CoA synthase